MVRIQPALVGFLVPLQYPIFIGDGKFSARGVAWLIFIVIVAKE